MGQFFQVKGQGCRSNLQFIRQQASRHPGLTCNNQPSEDGQPGFLRQRRKRCNDIVSFHILIIIEL
tara:strand:+ start:10138 stop:10335 length:198 start_codon:yes stop_codon:yes gene_type:complete